MSDIKSLKCACCKYYDTFDGCAAWSCADDFEISIEKTKEEQKTMVLMYMKFLL